MVSTTAIDQYQTVLSFVDTDKKHICAKRKVGSGLYCDHDVAKRARFGVKVEIDLSCSTVTESDFEIIESGDREYAPTRIQIFN